MKFKKSVLSFASMALLSSGHVFADASTPFTSLVTFGDSLTDGGAYTSTMLYGGAPSGLRYKFTTNYTDGSAKVWAEYLAASMGLTLAPNTVNTLTGTFITNGTGGTNYAQGGAQVSTDPAADYQPGFPAYSVKSQVDAFLTSNPKLNSSELFVLWAGANDVLNANPSSAAADVVQASGDLAAQIQRLKSAGATYIVVNGLPNIGQTPAFTNTNLQHTAYAASMTALSSLFNSTLKQDIQGMNVIYIDTAKLLNAVINDPTRFGFNAQAGAVPYGLYVYQQSGGTDSSCLTSAITCIVSPTAKAVANTFIFTDGIHPTDAAHAIFGQAAYGVLRAVGQQTTMLFAPSYAIRQHGIDLEPRLSPAALLKSDGLVRELRPVGDTQFWFGGSAGHFTNSASQVAASYSANTQLGSLGIDRMVTQNALLGAAFSYSMGQSSFGGGSGDYKSTLNLGTLYGTAFLSQHFYANATLQYGDMTFKDINRTVVLGPTSITSSGRTNGNYEAARIGLGYIDTYASWSISPSFSLTTSRTRVNGYSENDTAVSLAYGDAQYRSTFATWAISGRMNGAKDEWLPAFRLAVDRDLNNSSMTIGVGPDSSLIAKLPIDKPMKTFYNASVGAQRITDSGTWSVGVTATAGEALSTKGYSLSVGYKLPI